MRLRHIVITAVARDDLADGGAEHFRQTIEAVRELNPGIVIEVLVPDFNDRDASIETVLAANPHIFNHNLETVRRLTPEVRHRATYDRSLERVAKGEGPKRGDTIYTKSGLMLGLGETEEEVLAAMEDLRARRLRHSHARPVFAADAEASAGGGICHAGEICGIQGRAPRKWVLSTSPAGRWCAVPITRTNSRCRQ